MMKSKVSYINENQTDALKFSEHGETKYYFLAGYDVVSNQVPTTYKNKNIGFEIDKLDKKSFGDYKESIISSFKRNSKYPELSENVLFKDVFDFKLNCGDNVVNNQSQLGVKFTEGKDDSTCIGAINAAAQWMNIDTYFGHNPLNHLHGQNQHRKESIKKVIQYLQ